MILIFTYDIITKKAGDKMIDTKELYKDNYFDKEVELQGWVRNHRKQKEFGFIDFNDGTYFKNIQVVYENKLNNFSEIQKIKVGSAIQIKGKVIKISYFKEE